MAAVGGLVAALALAGCGPDSGGGAAAPAYGKEGPANTAQLDGCLAAQPDERKLVRSKVNGSLSADIRLVGQGAPTGPMVNTAQLENGRINGVPAAREISARMKALGEPALFEPYRSGGFAVYPAPRVGTLGKFQATVAACLPASARGI